MVTSVARVGSLSRRAPWGRARGTPGGRPGMTRATLARRAREMSTLSEMTAHGQVHMPSLGGATGWLNSEPLGPAELRGHVVVVNFWTLTCINWLHQEPCVRAW